MLINYKDSGRAADSFSQNVVERRQGDGGRGEKKIWERGARRRFGIERREGGRERKLRRK